MTWTGKHRLSGLFCPQELILKDKNSSVDGGEYRLENRYRQLHLKGAAIYQLIIVEDDVKTLRGLAHLFDWVHLGFAVAGAYSDGKEALNTLEHGAGCNAFLCDIRMPGVSGLEIAKHVYYRQSDVAVVLMSAYRDFDYARCALEYGVRHYILKPIDREELEETFIGIRRDLDDRFEGYLEFKDVNDRVIKIVEYYVNNNLANVTLCDCAEHVGLSPNYLSRFFKEKTGEKLSDFIAGKRMEKAKELLQDHRNLIYQVGNNLGYRDYRNFSRAFRNYFGTSPKEYRESMGYSCGAAN
jgi:YesN/AraC family two-component response regulator